MSISSIFACFKGGGKVRASKAVPKGKPFDPFAANLKPVDPKKVSKLNQAHTRAQNQKYKQADKFVARNTTPAQKAASRQERRDSIQRMQQLDPKNMSLEHIP